MKSGWCKNRLEAEVPGSCSEYLRVVARTPGKDLYALSCQIEPGTQPSLRTFLWSGGLREELVWVILHLLMALP